MLTELVAAHEKYARALERCQADAPDIFRTMRKKLGLRQQDMADRMGVTNVYLSRVENGRMVAGYATLAALMKVATEAKG